MNLLMCLLGGFPMCHGTSVAHCSLTFVRVLLTGWLIFPSRFLPGAGGLAGQYRFGGVSTRRNPPLPKILTSGVSLALLLVISWLSPNSLVVISSVNFDSRHALQFLF
jgi:hypothetical protein